MVKQGKDQGSQRMGSLSLKPSKTVLVIVAVILALALTIFAVLRSQDVEFSSIALRIDDEIIFQDDYDKFIKSANDLGVKEDGARDVLINYRKNKIALDKLDVSTDQELIDAQWNLVLGDISSDYLSAQKHKDKIDTLAGQALAFNRYVEMLKVDGNNKSYVGSVYHFPYMDVTKNNEQSLANDVYKKVKSIDGDLSDDRDLIEEQLSKTTQPSASYSGLYIIKEDSAASKVGGSFGLRPGLVPEEVTKSLGDQSLPYVSELIDVDLSGFYIVRVVGTFDVGDDFTQALNKETNKVRVVEYDR